MKKVTIRLFLSIMFLVPFLLVSVHAEEGKRITLVEESFEDYDGFYGEIYRYYEIKGEEGVFPYGIRVPDSIYQKIKDAENPLLEAKKEMTIAYRFLGLENRLKELNGVYLSPYRDNNNVVVAEALKPTFNKDLDIINQYADNQLQLIGKLSKKEQIALYDTENIEFVDYEKEEEYFKARVPDYDEVKEMYEQDVKAMNEISQLEDVEEKQPIGFYIVIGLILAIVVTLVIFVFKKRG